MEPQDKDVRVKVTHINTVTTNGEPHEAWMLVVEGQYRATFRHESDLNWFLTFLQEQIEGKLVFEQVYRDP